MKKNEGDDGRSVLESCNIGFRDTQKIRKKNWNYEILNLGNHKYSHRKRIQKEEEKGDFIAEVRNPEMVKVPAGQKVQVRCRVKGSIDGNEQTVYFAPRLSIDDENFEVLETVTKLRRGKTNYVHVKA